MKTLSERLAVEFATPGKRPSEVAKLCHVNESTVSRWISGRLVPSDDKLKIMARYFGVHYIELKYGISEFKAAHDEYRRIHLIERLKIEEEIAVSYGEALSKAIGELVEVREERNLFKAILIKKYL